MGYTVSLTSSAAQAEGQTGGTPAKFVFTLTREAGDASSETAYSYEIRHADTLILANTAPASNPNVPDFSGISAITNGAAAGGAADDGNFTWTLNQTTLTLTIDANLDTTTEPNENFVVWFFRETGGIHQRFNDGLSFSPTSTITITNDDTGPPVFTSSATLDAAENGTAVGTVAATGNGAVTYALNGGADAAQFAVNAATGALTFLAPNDYEIPDDTGGNRVYDVIVRASAAGQNTDQAIAVTLTNVNEAPTITTNGGVDVAVGVNENVATTFATVAAQSGPGANEPSDTVTWSLAGADAAAFTIDSTTGELRFTTGRSFEAPTDAGGNNVYDVQVRATDSGGLTDTINYAVTVANVAEAPVISSNGGADFAFVSVPENVTGTIATVAATDDDTAGPIAYSIFGGADAADFAIDAATGALSFLAAPNFEAPADADLDNSYQVVVRATSGGLTDDQTLNVFVTNVIESGVPSDVPSAGGGGGGGVVTPPPPSNTGNDIMPGTSGTDSFAGGTGNDTLTGEVGEDQLDGDTGNDIIYGGQGSDFIRGLNDNDTVYGDEGADTVNGNMGDDVVDGGSGDDTVYGGQGQDTVYGGDGNDIYVNGNIGNDIVHGGEGDDSVYGGQNSDTVHGDAGNDRVTGDLGNDVLYGEAGADRFVMLNTGGDDWVADWNFAEGDRIQLANGQAYTVSNVGGQAFISLGPTAGIGLAGVSFSSFSSDWIIFGA